MEHRRSVNPPKIAGASKFKYLQETVKGDASRSTTISNDVNCMTAGDEEYLALGVMSLLTSTLTRHSLYLGNNYTCIVTIAQ